MKTREDVIKEWADKRDAVYADAFKFLDEIKNGTRHPQEGEIKAFTQAMLAKLNMINDELYKALEEK